MVANLVGSSTKPKREAYQSNEQYRSYNPFNRGVWFHFQERTRERFHFGTYVAIFLLTVLATLVLFIPLLNHFNRLAISRINAQDVPCGDSCRIELVETIPEGLEYNGSVKHTETSDMWKKLIQNSNSSIEIASFYWTMRENETYSHPSSKTGEEIFQALLHAGLDRNISIRIVQNQPSKPQEQKDTEYLAKVKAAQVRSLNFSQLVGAGVLHTKFWIFDRRHVYIGSANMDWRALTQVKELGAGIYDCPCMAEDLGKIFDVYWTLGEEKSVPQNWPQSFWTKYNANTPLNVTIRNKTNLAYFSSSPPSFSPKGRTHDIDALLRTISNAKKFVYISVMDYFPLTLYTKKQKFWPVIDNEIRRAVIERGVNVRILISQWNSTRLMLFNFMNSLNSLNEFNKKVKVETKKFKVPSTPEQSKIPYARVNHNKYMVTDNGVFIGTSNWSADYFIDTAGVSLVMTTNNSTDNTIREQLLAVFERDWFSNYSHKIY